MTGVVQRSLCCMRSVLWNTAAHNKHHQRYSFGCLSCHGGRRLSLWPPAGKRDRRWRGTRWRTYEKRVKDFCWQVNFKACTTVWVTVTHGPPCLSECVCVCASASTLQALCGTHRDTHSMHNEEASAHVSFPALQANQRLDGGTNETDLLEQRGRGAARCRIHSPTELHITHFIFAWKKNSSDLGQMSKKSKYRKKFLFAELMHTARR